MSVNKYTPENLVVEGEANFAGVWEAFCFKVLQLRNRGHDIQRLGPPDNGIDIYDWDENIAYQCKSVEATSGNFNATHASNSYERAEEAKKNYPWSTYVICTNSNVSGRTIANLKAKHSNLEVYARLHWDKECADFAEELKLNFKNSSDVASLLLEQRRIDLLSRELDEIKELYDLFHRKVLSAPDVQEDPFRMTYAFREIRCWLQQKGVKTASGEAGGAIKEAERIIADTETESISRFPIIGKTIPFKPGEEINLTRLYAAHRKMKVEDWNEAVRFMMNVRAPIFQQLEIVENRIETITAEIIRLSGRKV